MFRSITFEVTGEQRLACAGCAERVERMLKALPGVRQVRAKVSNQTVEVLFGAAAVGPAAIAERLSNAGYQTKISSSTSDLAN